MEAIPVDSQNSVGEDVTFDGTNYLTVLRRADGIYGKRYQPSDGAPLDGNALAKGFLITSTLNSNGTSTASTGNGRSLFVYSDGTHVLAHLIDEANGGIGTPGGFADGGWTDAGYVATDAGHAAADAGHAVTDAGHAATDAGHAATDAGHAATDAGHAATDAGHAATDAGHAATDAGSPPTDSGTPLADAGHGARDAGASSSDDGGSIVHTDAGQSAQDAGATPRPDAAVDGEGGGSHGGGLCALRAPGARGSRTRNAQAVMALLLGLVLSRRRRTRR